MRETHILTAWCGVHRWIHNEAPFGAQAVYLDNAYCDGSASTAGRNTASAYSDDIGCKNADLGTAGEYSPMRDNFQLFKDHKINYVAPPMQMLIAVQNGKYVPSDYAKVCLSPSPCDGVVFSLSASRTVSR
jgi:glycerophosphoryl diester phosphodiesterase